MHTFLKKKIKVSMALKKAVISITIIFFLISCAQKVVQGEHIEKENLDQVKVGMTKNQVAYLIGTPLVKDLSDDNNWVYNSFEFVKHGTPELKQTIIKFDSNGLVSSVDTPKPNK